ncbi:MAG: type IV pilus modification protein PilV [Pseudomonadota bacterium]
MFIVKRRQVMRGCNTPAMRGASLIEVLISVLLAAIGLLALVGANVASVRYSKMSQYRGTATMLSADLAERMRSNPLGLASYAVSSNFTTQASAPAASTACEGYTNTCTAAQMAAYDLATWRRIVRSQLPEGSVSVTPSATVAGADVWLAWRDPAVAAPDDNTTDARNYTKECAPNFSTEKSVRCIYFRINL